VRRLGVDVGKKFKIGELSSIEMLLEAHDKFVSDYRGTERCAKQTFLGKVAQTGNFDFVKYFWKVKKCRKSYRVTEGAASGGHLELLKYLHEKKWKFVDSAARSAASNGDLECLKYLIEEVNLNYRGSDSPAAIKGRINILQYFVDRDLLKSYFACEWAAKYGQLDALKFLHENGWSWNRKTVNTQKRTVTGTAITTRKNTAARNKYMREYSTLKRERRTETHTHNTIIERETKL